MEAKLLMKYLLAAGCAAVLSMGAVAAPKLIVVGDSLTADRPTNAVAASWARALEKYMKPGCTIDNHAKGGASTKSFFVSGRWAKAVESVKPPILQARSVRPFFTPRRVPLVMMAEVYATPWACSPRQMRAMRSAPSRGSPPNHSIRTGPSPLVRQMKAATSSAVRAVMDTGVQPSS